jgi:hypothetical protein
MKKLSNGQICEECLKEMFRRVGLEYPNEELTKDPKWYTKYTWTEAEENDFRKWMLAFVKKHARWTAKHAAYEVGMFLLNWGWSSKETK